MDKIKKGMCLRCREIKILSSKNICITCEKGYTGPSTEVRSNPNPNLHKFTEVKSKTGMTKTEENMWMGNFFKKNSKQP